MKTWLCLLLAAFAFSAGAQTPVLESQKAAIKLYPDLGVPGSAFNKRFVELVEAAKRSDPQLMQRDEWPMTIAQHVSADLGAKAEASGGGGASQAENMQVAKMGIDPGNKVGVFGKVIQRMTEGNLVESSGGNVGGWRGVKGLVFIRGGNAAMGSTVKLSVVPAGTFKYTAVDGGENIVDAFVVK
jgi:hypothetical protein